MARTTTVVTIFLASPGDVTHERQIVARFVNEWNEINGRLRSVNFDLLRWETGVSAGFGSDGQDVVNQQIGGEYDILIAIFWTRLGTPTPRAASGSAEEYERALERFRKGENIEIAFYFKDSVIEPRTTDLEQLAAVQAFESSVQDQGAFSKIFKDDDSLRFELGILLDRMARRFGDPHMQGASQSGAVNTLGPAATQRLMPHLDESGTSLVDRPAVDNDDEPGLFDITESLQQHATDASKFLSEMTARLDVLSHDTAQITGGFEEISKSRPLEIGDIKPAIPRISDGMNGYSDFLEQGLPAFSENSAAMAQDVRMLIDVSQDFSTSKSEMEELQITLSALITGMDSSMAAYQGLLESTLRMQRTTSVFNRARRRLVQNLRLMISTMVNTKSLVEQALAELIALIERICHTASNDLEAIGSEGGA